MERCQRARPTVCHAALMRRVIVNNVGAGYSLLVGGWESTASHRHFAVHLCLTFEGPIAFRTDGEHIEADDAVVIGENVRHELFTPAPDEGVVLSVTPIANLGIYLRERLEGRDWTTLSGSHVAEIRSLGVDLLDERLSSDEFIGEFDAVVSRLVAEPYAQQLSRYDQRIVQALWTILRDPDSLVPADDLAESLGMSTSRFLHLFRSELGITYRRMEIWIRLAKATAAFGQFDSLTDLAHEFGFSDSAHFSRAFKETFGYSPSAYYARSQFVQAGHDTAQ